jgi:hypothetical protein
MAEGSTTADIFHFVMIKPSHYDDDGYPIQWLRSAIPSNTLACLFALADDARRRDGCSQEAQGRRSAQGSAPCCGLGPYRPVGGAATRVGRSA